MLWNDLKFNFNFNNKISSKVLFLSVVITMDVFQQYNFRKIKSALFSNLAESLKLLKITTLLYAKDYCSNFDANAQQNNAQQTMHNRTKRILCNKNPICS